MRPRKKNNHSTRGGALGQSFMCVCVCVSMRVSAHAMDLLQTVTTAKTLGRVLNSKQFFQAHVSQQSTRSSLPLFLPFSLTFLTCLPSPTFLELFPLLALVCLSHTHTHTKLLTQHPPSIPMYMLSLPFPLLLLLAVVDD